MTGEFDPDADKGAPTQAGSPRLWFEDLHEGRSFMSREYEVTEREIVAFARQYDPQPFHTDPIAAQATFFKGLAASGWHTASITMRLVSESLPLAWGVIGAGTDHLSWPKATRPGDRLRVRSRVQTLRPLKSRPDRGLVVFLCETIDQRDEVVQILMPKLFAPLRAHYCVQDRKQEADPTGS